MVQKGEKSMAQLTKPKHIIHVFILFAMIEAM
jgi:hypothetical protein